MTGNISYLSDFEEINEGYVSFGGNPKGGKIIGKGKIRTCKLDFDDVYFVEEVKFNLFNVSQMCDKKNNVLFTDTECVILSSDFKLLDENHVLLRVPRENNMYNVDLKNIVPSRDLTCLFTKATLDESNLWHRRLGHINFKTMNKLVKGNLVRGLPSKFFENNHTCVACKKGKQHRASCKTKPFREMKRIKREFSVARTPQQNRVAERKNRTLIEAARTMLPDLLLPISFWADAVNTACYVLNRIPNESLMERLMRDFWLDTLSGPTWMFDIDTLTQSMNYQPVVAGNQPNSSAGIQENFDEGNIGKETVSTQQYVLLPLWSTSSNDPQNTDADAAFDDKENESTVYVSPRVKDLNDEFEEFSINNTNGVNAASTPVTAVGPNLTNSTNNFNAAGPSDNVVSSTFEIGGKSSFVDPSQYPDDPNIPALEDIIYSDDEEDVGAEADFFNLDTSITVSPIPTTRVHKAQAKGQEVGEEETIQIFRIKEIKKDANEDVTLEDIDAKVAMDADVQGRLAESQAKVVTTAATATTITVAQVPKASAPRRRKGVVIKDPKETATASVIVHSKDNTVMRYQALKKKPVTEAQARKNIMVYLKNMARFKMDFFKAKKQRIDEETEELKTHLHIVANDDDVYTEASPLALKVPVIDDQIHHENNKPYYKIIRADGTHQLFLSFITLLKNFDKEDLEMLWKLV
nr:ribonuclease H-like domain-containing protein [Tanacetum cinerariifolium]